MLLENINEVIKASPAIQIQGKMTHLQRRAWNILLANAYNELRDKTSTASALPNSRRNSGMIPMTWTTSKKR